MGKEAVLKVFAKVGTYLLQFCKVMWEDCLKEYLEGQIKTLITNGISLFKAKRETEEYQEKRDDVITYVLDKIQLPTILKPFKWLIKKIIKDTVAKGVDEAIEKLEEKFA